MGTGGFILGYLGGLVRWIFGTVWRTIARKERFKFIEYMNGPEKSEDWFDQTGHQFVNRIVGMMTIVAIVIIILKLGI